MVNKFALFTTYCYFVSHYIGYTGCHCVSHYIGKTNTYLYPTILGKIICVLIILCSLLYLFAGAKRLSYLSFQILRESGALYTGIRSSLSSFCHSHTYKNMPHPLFTQLFHQIQIHKQYFYDKNKGNKQAQSKLRVMF